jgi:hypothetical protein
MIDQQFIDNLRACAEGLKNSAQMLYEVTQKMQSGDGDKEVARNIVSVEGYLELVGGEKRDVNKARKAIAQELNVSIIGE